MIIKAGNTSDMSRIQVIIYVLSLEIETEDFFLSPAVLLRSFPFHRGRGGTENQALSLPHLPRHRPAHYWWAYSPCTFSCTFWSCYTPISCAWSYNSCPSHARALGLNVALATPSVSHYAAPLWVLPLYWPKEIMHRSWKRLMPKCKKINLNNHVIL